MLRSIQLYINILNEGLIFVNITKLVNQIVVIIQMHTSICEAVCTMFVALRGCPFARPHALKAKRIPLHETPADIVIAK